MVQFGNIPTKLKKKGLEEKLLKVCRDNDVVFMGIFGSFVRGEQKRRSDVDIAIECREGTDKSLFDLVDLQFALTRIFSRKVDVGIMHCLNKYIIDDVKKEMKIIYRERDRSKK